MISVDENALICDLAEVYNIYDYRSLPLLKIAAFSVGLRDDSRIKMKMNGMKYSLEKLLLASISDRLALLLWINTKDGTNGVNKPNLILNEMLNSKDEEKCTGFNTPEDFLKEWENITKGG